MSKKNVAITGLGFITSIGNDAKSVAESLVSLKKSATSPSTTQKYPPNASAR